MAGLHHIYTTGRDLPAGEVITVVARRRRRCSRRCARTHLPAISLVRAPCSGCQGYVTTTNALGMLNDMRSGRFDSVGPLRRI